MRWNTIFLLLGGVVCLAMPACKKDVRKQLEVFAGATLSDDETEVDVFKATGSDFVSILLQDIGPLRIVNYNDCDLSAKGMLQLAKTRIETLSIVNCRRVTDDGMAGLSSLHSLRDLTLLNTPISNDGLEHIDGLKRLRRLCISGISDEGLYHLRNLRGLEELELMYTDVTPEGIEHLQKLSKLKVIKFHRCHVSQPVTHKIRRLLPQCKVHQS